ncbi:MAG TPA: glycoside hydrolase family 28 protein [Anaerolineales bacterium]|nr:glycoside hydrolase family 28 protein [Anaerolineales bacterium]
MTVGTGLTSVWNVRDHGATGDGQTLDSPSIQSTIDACAGRGGGTVYLPTGRYLAGSLFLRDNITLFLDSGAMILGSEDPDDYPVIHSRWEGRHQDTHAPLIGGDHLRDIAVTGRGTIDGRGAVWWRAKEDKTLAHPRPRLVSFSDCSNVLIESITAVNSPSWTINPVHCENVNIRGITIVNPADSPNTDGINPDSCRLVRISDCYVSVGDDCITIKSGTEHEQPDLCAPCRDITITNCTLERGHGGVVIGSEMSGGVKNVVISNCVFIGTDRGIRIKSRRGRGGTIEDIRVSNLIMDGVLCPFTMNLYYHVGVRGDLNVSDKSPRSVDDGTPRLRRIHFSHVTARDVKHAAGFLYGLAEMPLEDISFSDVSISVSAEADSGYPEMADDIPSMSQAGFFIRNARHLRLEHVEVTGQVGEAFDVADCEDVVIVP